MSMMQTHEPQDQYLATARQEKPLYYTLFILPTAHMVTPWFQRLRIYIIIDIGIIS